MALRPKQQRFVDEYLVDLNATAAYQRAGYVARGGAARANAARLLTNANVAAAVRAGQRARAERVEVTQDYVLRGLKREAEFSGEGCSHGARVSAFKLLGQHRGMFVDRHEIKGTVEHVGDVGRAVLADREARRLAADALARIDRGRAGASRNGDQPGPVAVSGSPETPE